MRSLLLGIGLVAAALALWTRPQTVETHRPDGTLLARFRLQRNWRGELVARGPQEWYLPEGGCYRRQEVQGAILRNGELQGDASYGDPVYPAHRPPDPPTLDYVLWLRHDHIPISTDLPSTAGRIFSYP